MMLYLKKAYNTDFRIPVYRNAEKIKADLCDDDQDNLGTQLLVSRPNCLPQS